MSLWSRFANVFRGERLSRDIDEEMESHIRAAFQIVGVIRNARYDDPRGPFPPVAYRPTRDLDDKGVVRPMRSATLMERMPSANPLALASTLRREAARGPDFM